MRSSSLVVAMALMAPISILSCGQRGEPAPTAPAPTVTTPATPTPPTPAPAPPPAATPPPVPTPTTPPPSVTPPPTRTPLARPVVAQPQQQPSAARVRVSVRATGYEPATINATANQPLTIVFNRVDDGGCGGEVVFPEQNIRRTLPAGQDVEITITPRESQQIHFACGMGMLHGTVIASH